MTITGRATEAGGPTAAPATATVRPSITPAPTAPPAAAAIAQQPAPTTPSEAEQRAARERLSQRLVQQFTQVTESSSKDVAAGNTPTVMVADASTRTTVKPKETAEKTRPTISSGLLDCTNPRFVEDNPERCRTKPPEKPTEKAADVLTAKPPDGDSKKEQPKDVKTAYPADTTSVAAASDTDITKQGTASDKKEQTTGNKQTPDTQDCSLRARRICTQQTAKKDILLLSDFDIRDALTADRGQSISPNDSAVQQSLALLSEDPKTITLTAENAKETAHSRHGYCVHRVAQYCERSETDGKLASADCSDPKFVKENTQKCPLQPVQQAECIGGNASIPATSSTFDVDNARVLKMPDAYKPDQLGELQLLESDDLLQQYILLPKETADAKVEVLVVDPKTGLSRILGLPDKSKKLYVVRDADNIGSILMMVAPEGIKYFPSALTRVKEYMNSTSPQTDFDVTTWKSVAIPADQSILFAQPNGKGVVAITGDDDGVMKGTWFFASMSDTDGKFIPAPADAADHTLSKAVITPDNDKLAVNLVLASKPDEGSKLSVIHSDDILADAPFTKLDDDAANAVISEKTKVKTSVTAVEKASAKKKLKDKDQFEKSLSEAIASKAVGEPVAIHPFEDYGDNLSALVKKDNAIALANMSNGAVSPKEGELLPLGADKAPCGTLIGTFPVDADNAGGKDIALVINNDGVTSMVVYPNINQVQKFETVTAESMEAGLQLHQKSVSEENEVLTCHWEAQRIGQDGKAIDVSMQLDNADSCDPVFKTKTPTPKTSLMKKSSTFDVAVDWLIAQIDIRSAYAEDATTATKYKFIVTTSDPVGVQATAQIMVEVSETATKGVQGTDAGAAGAAGAGSSTTTSTLPKIKIVDVEMLTPTQKEKIATQGDVTIASSETMPNVGLSSDAGGSAGVRPTDKEVTTNTGGGDGSKEGAGGSGGGCSLIRHSPSGRDTSAQPER